MLMELPFFALRDCAGVVRLASGNVEVEELGVDWNESFVCPPDFLLDSPTDEILDRGKPHECVILNDKVEFRDRAGRPRQILIWRYTGQASAKKASCAQYPPPHTQCVLHTAHSVDACLSQLSVSPLLLANRCERPLHRLLFSRWAGAAGSSTTRAPRPLAAERQTSSRGSALPAPTQGRHEPYSPPPGSRRSKCRAASSEQRRCACTRAAMSLIMRGTGDGS